MSYNYKSKKITAVLVKNLEFGVALNVIGHLAISIGAYADKDIMGRKELFDASNISHLGISKYPFIITKTTASKIKKTIELVCNMPDILVADYPSCMLNTGHDDELYSELKKTPNDEIQYYGIILYGSSEKINELTKKFSLWR